jgi:hypothetical protein
MTKNKTVIVSLLEIGCISELHTSHLGSTPRFIFGFYPRFVDEIPRIESQRIRGKARQRTTSS